MRKEREKKKDMRAYRWLRGIAKQQLSWHAITGISVPNQYAGSKACRQ
jgi:hypothetical protein